MSFEACYYPQLGHKLEKDYRLKKLMTFALENDLEIVSFGLAPNPNGFCFESHGDASDKVKNYFSTQLDTLNKYEIETLKKWSFGP